MLAYIRTEKNTLGPKKEKKRKKNVVRNHFSWIWPLRLLLQRNIKTKNQMHIGMKRKHTHTPHTYTFFEHLCERKRKATKNNTNALSKNHFGGCNQKQRSKKEWKELSKTVNEAVHKNNNNNKRNSTKLKSRKRQYCAVIQANAKRFSQIRLHLWDTLTNLQYRFFLKPANNFILGVLLAVPQLFYRWIYAVVFLLLQLGTFFFFLFLFPFPHTVSTHFNCSQ